MYIVRLYLTELMRMYHIQVAFKVRLLCRQLQWESGHPSFLSLKT